MGPACGSRFPFLPPVIVEVCVETELLLSWVTTMGSPFLLKLTYSSQNIFPGGGAWKQAIDLTEKLNISEH